MVNQYPVHIHPTTNWQLLPFLGQQKGENEHRKHFIITVKWKPSRYHQYYRFLKWLLKYWSVHQSELMNLLLFLFYFFPHSTTGSSFCSYLIFFYKMATFEGKNWLLWTYRQVIISLKLCFFVTLWFYTLVNTAKVMPSWSAKLLILSDRLWPAKWSTKQRAHTFTNYWRLYFLDPRKGEIDTAIPSRSISRKVRWPG